MTLKRGAVCYVTTGNGSNLVYQCCHHPLSQHMVPVYLPIKWPSNVMKSLPRNQSRTINRVVLEALHSSCLATPYDVGSKLTSH